MSDKLLESVLQRHNEVVSRLEDHESNSKKNKNYLIAVAITAVLGGGGGATALINKDDMGPSITSHVAVYEEWKPEVTENIDALNHQVTALREAMIRIQVTIEGLSDKRRGSSNRLKSRLDEVESLLDEVDRFNKKQIR